MASSYPPKKGVAFTLFFTLYKSDGTVVADPGAYTKKVSIDGGNIADVTAAVTEENTTYGQLSLVLSTSEMNGDCIWVYITDDTAGTVPFTCTLYTTANTQDEIGSALATVDGIVDAIKVVTDNLDHWEHGALTFDANTPSAGYTTMKLYNSSTDALLKTWVITNATGNRAKAT